MEEQESASFDIGRYIVSLKRNWLLLFTIFVSSVTLGVVGSTFVKPSYDAEGRLLFKLPNFKVIGSNVTSGGSEGEETGTLRSFVSNQNPINTEIEVMSSANILEKIITQLNMKDKTGKPLSPEVLSKGLKMKILRNTDVVSISYNSKSPREAAEVINKLMQIYIENDILSNRFEAVTTRDFLAKQLPMTEQALKDAEAVLRDFKQKNAIVDLGEETKSIVGIIANLNNQITETQASVSALVTQIKNLQNQLNLSSEQVLAIFNISKSPAVQNVLLQIQEIDRQLAVERSRFSELNPTVINLQAKKNNLNLLLQREIEQLLGARNVIPVSFLQLSDLQQQLIKDLLQAETQRASLSEKLVSLYNYRQKYNQRAEVIPELLENQRALEQQLEAARSTYTNLLNKLQELQIAANKNTANARIISKAEVPQKPQITKKLIVIVGGVFLGIILCATTFIIIVITDTTLKTVKEIKDSFKTPLLGVVPEIPETSSPIVDDAQIVNKNATKSFISEIYNSMQTNLRFLSSDETLKTLVITSCISGEGKSTVASNLANALARINKKVLLIDADFNLSSQHHFWNIPNHHGLSDVLVGEKEFEDAVCIINDNLHILTAGFKPPEPMNLIDSKRMIELMQEFRENYDFVIIDSPSLLISVEAVSLGKHTDGTILVSKPGLLDYTSVSATQELFAQYHQNLVGVIVNGMLPDDRTNKFFSHAKAYFTEAEKVNYLKTIYIDRKNEQKPMKK